MNFFSEMEISGSGASSMTGSGLLCCLSTFSPSEEKEDPGDADASPSLGSPIFRVLDVLTESVEEPIEVFMRFGSSSSLPASE